ncbi:hypothetical protein F5B20DRAFT_25159 [Whalleya microplaca]|nr:hypothetical protein F5B20DRAFT_25159 [Whalleya microplaca]
MATAPQFRYFLQLPTELQLIIWGFYDSQPPIRHCFSLNAHHKRVYAAFDESCQQVIRRLGQRGDWSAAPHDKMIRLTGVVLVETHPQRINTIWDKFCSTKRLTAPSPFVFVNFERDIFYFNQCSYISPYSGSHEWFRFLHNPIDSLFPAGDEHWIFSVQKLALRMDCLRPGNKLKPWDLETLSRMASLKTVLLVVPQQHLMAWASDPSGLNVAIGQIKDKKMFVPMNDLLPNMQPQVAKSIKVVEEAVISALGDHVGHIDVQIVVDPIDP